VTAQFSRTHSNGANGDGNSGPPGGANGSGGDTPRARHTPWEFRVLIALVALMAIGIVLAWTLVGSKSPERLDSASTALLSTACADAQAQLKALPNAFPRTGPDRVTRVRAENTVIRTMIGRFSDVHPRDKTPAAAVRGWSDDWAKVVDARDRYATKLEATRGTDEKVQFVLPASRGLKPITKNMDDFVRENHPNLMPCFTERLELERVEGRRDYRDVTE
jgi:hypothetical protein